MSETSENIEISLSFLQRLEEECSQEYFEDNTFFNQLEDSFACSLQLSNSSSLKTSQISHIKGEVQRIDQTGPHIHLSLSDENLPTGRVLMKIDQLSNLTLSNRLYCKFCKIYGFSVVHYQQNHGNFWDTLIDTIKNLKCCSEKKKNDYLLVHRCKNCGNILAKVFTSQSFQELI